MAGLSDMFRPGAAAAGHADEADALKATRRLIRAGAAAVLILGAGLVNSALDSVRRIDAVAVEAETRRAERAIAALTVDGALAAADVRLLDEDYGLAGARLVAAASAREGEVMVTLRGASPHDAPIHVAWTPRRFGSEMFSTLAPRRIAMSALLTVIVGSVFFWLSRAARELDRHRRAAQELAIRDSLTGLANRRHFDEKLRARLAGSKRTPCALVCLDLDDFKLVNDSMGHAAGDELLRSIAARLQALAGPADLVARLGGDEFAIIRMADVGGVGLAAFARSVILEVCRPHRVRDVEVAVGVSIGIARAPGDGISVDDLMHQADTALYKAKAAAGPTYVFAGAEKAEAEIDRHAA